MRACVLQTTCAVPTGGSSSNKGAVVGGVVGGVVAAMLVALAVAVLCVRRRKVGRSCLSPSPLLHPGALPAGENCDGRGGHGAGRLGRRGRCH